MVVVILFVLVLLLLIQLYLDRKQVVSLRKQIEFIRDNKTNMELTTSIRKGGFRRLALAMNTLLKEIKKREYVTRKQEDSFKQSITSISHDLRTPLTSATGYIQMLNKGDLDEEKQKEYLQIIGSRIRSVNEMLNQLFEYTRLEAGEYPLEMKRMDLNGILCDTISMFYEELVQNNIEPEIQMEEKAFWVEGDSSAFIRVIENILGNAIKYGKKHIQINLTEEEEQVKLQISNETDCIEQGDVAHIFERFYTTDVSKMKKSTGLGLAIAREFIEKMGGEIKAELEGERFSIIIQMPSLK
ncbi:sensor histidine kinase [Anaerosporobacter faecicola]|uniref:sensor histidine kinase n=1 Tax=Anaerosporobacter faecicola TaxID=2718714 RepID=UPI00143A59E4|nr:HAMP domain-containing sensor histidine kinase [Anaerosporobacter faecicola]